MEVDCLPTTISRIISMIVVLFKIDLHIRSVPGRCSLGKTNPSKSINQKRKRKSGSQSFGWAFFIPESMSAPSVRKSIANIGD